MLASIAFRASPICRSRIDASKLLVSRLGEADREPGGECQEKPLALGSMDAEERLVIFA